METELERNVRAITKLNESVAIGLTNPNAADFNKERKEYLAEHILWLNKLICEVLNK
jgi:hypothetical protein